jgi:ABC-type transporter Mla subunit MlaD
MASIIEPKETSQPAKASGAWSLPVILGLVGLVILLGATIVLFTQLRSAKADLQAKVQTVSDQVAKVEKRVGDVDQAVEGAKARTEAVAERVGMTEKELDKAESVARQIREEQRKGFVALGGEVGQVKQDVETSRAAIAETQAQLQRTIGDLGEQSGLIARNSDELAQLKHSTARDYFEFDLGKAKQPAQIGPVAIRLRSVDVKRNRYTMQLIVDDLEIEKKDKTLLEPVQFYRKGTRQLNEIVVFTVAKDRVAGYLSTPKAAPAAAATTK